MIFLESRLIALKNIVTRCDVMCFVFHPRAFWLKTAVFKPVNIINHTYRQQMWND